MQTVPRTYPYFLPIQTCAKFHLLSLFNFLSNESHAKFREKKFPAWHGPIFFLSSSFPEMASKYLHFFVLDNSNCTAICKICSHPKPLKFSPSSKTNLKTHYERHTATELAAHGAHAIGTETITSAFQPYPKQEPTTDDVVDFVIEGDHPIGIVDKPYFRKFMKKRDPRWRPICKKTLRAKIIAKGQPFQFNAKEYISRYGKPSTTVDLWTSRARRGFMAVTLHLHNKQKFETKVMDLAYTPSPHTAANIRSQFINILGQYGMGIDDIFKTSCDNASNMKKAFCVSFWDEEIDGESEQETDLDEVNDMEVPVDDVFEDEFRNRCNIHTLQLAVNDMLKVLPKRYDNVIAKCKLACKKQHQSQALTEKAKKIMPDHCTTRWNGQWVLMKVILDEFEAYKLDYGFVDSDKAPLANLVTFFAPFFHTTKALEAEKFATIHQVVPLLCGLERHVSSTTSIPNEYKQKCVDVLGERFAAITTDALLLTASVLSPHGLNWLSKAPRVCLKFGSQQDILEMVHTYLSHLSLDLPKDLFPKHSDLKDCQTDSFESNLEHILGYSDSSLQNSMNWKEELDQHLLRTPTLSFHSDPLVYWKNMDASVLSVLAIQVLSVPASSAPVERVFS